MKIEKEKKKKKKYIVSVTTRPIGQFSFGKFHFKRVTY